MKKRYLFFLIIVAIIAILFFIFKPPIQLINQSVILNNQSSEQNLPTNGNQDNFFSLPIDRAGDRVTKKPFGIYITSKNSPVQPEKFSGYHAGVDFEIFSDEENKDIAIKTICDGPIIFQDFVSGYGGAVVQGCQFKNQDITVLYGHLKLSSISKIKSKNFPAGETLGLLGQGFTSETDYERKHLHLGIHLGSEINFKGYVSNKSDLVNWLDITQYFFTL